MELVIYSNMSYYSFHRAGGGEVVWKYKLSMPGLLLVVVNVYILVELPGPITVLCSQIHSFCLARRVEHL